VTLSGRDKKIALAIVPILALVGYWFLLFSPKREEAAKAKTELTDQTKRRDAARATMSRARAAKTEFAGDYGEIVRLGKAIPAHVDMPSLLVQLDRAAEGTGIKFTKIATGDRQVAVSATPAPGTGTPPAGGGTPPAGGTTPPPTAAGGEAAQSAPGTAAEAANGAAATSNQRNSAAEQSGLNPTDTQTSTSSGSGLPLGGGAATGGDTPATGTSTGLETVPLELEFEGDFFHLADFFHDVKRFVHVVNTDVVVNGRLVTVEGFDLTSDPLLFPRIKASLKATIYLSPKAEGATAGASPQGPAVTTTPAGAPAPAPSGGTTPAATPAPTAAATP
jgi:Tfp pilus assembly protein PilO